MERARVERVLDAAPERMDDLQDLVADMWATEPTVAASDRIRFEMAVVEIFGNIVEHSVRRHAGPPVRRVEVLLTVSDESVVARFADDGRPVAIDLHEVTMPSPDAEDGRGLAMALAAVDDLSYERKGDINRWTVTCTRSASIGPTVTA